ncbi:MAG: fumarylacetoacetate hydrolase family protein [Betaproteobacteria bacterium]
MVTPLQDSRVARGLSAQLALKRSKLAAGARCIGWKVGFGAPAAMARLEIAAPLTGFLIDRGQLESGATLDLSGWHKPVAEPEIAVHMKSDLPGGAQRDAVAAAIAGIGPAIELADVDRPPDDVEAILSGNIYQRHVIVGRCETARAGGNLVGLLACIRRNGGEIARTSDLQALTGEMIDIVCHVATTLAACGEHLRAGEIIITGSIVPPLWVEPGEEIVYALEPVDTVSVRFAARTAAA